jgi:exopolysaccharide biosynthesis polyprenyl glycosylphosphotransferase
MYHGKKQRFDWTFALCTTDIVAILLAFAVASPVLALIRPGDFSPPLITLAAYFILIIYIARRAGIYSWISFTQLVHGYVRLLGTLVLSIIAFMAFRYLFGNESPKTYESWLLIHALIAFLLTAVSRALLRYLLMDRLRLIPVERIAFYGWGVRMERVLRALSREMGSFQEIVGFFYSDKNPKHSAAFEKGFHPLGTLAEVEKNLLEKHISLLIVYDTTVTPEQLQKLGEICSRCFVNLKVIPNACDIWASKLSVRTVAGIPLMGVYALRYDQFHNRVAKRLFDIAGALFGLAISAPVIAIMALMIKRESPGPIFFRQTRLGIHEKPFKIIKLRSMRLDAEQKTGAIWASQDDPRRLKIGTFMRKTNIDELPQFWNVLMGDMSLVGPRPERPEFVEGFKETIRYYNLRHSCKPGLTGWAAVHGLRGDTSLEDRLEYDLYYIENWSIMLDIRIMFMTLAPPKNAY